MDLEEYLGQFRWRDPDPALKPRVLGAAPAALPWRRRRRAWVLGAVAALFLISGVGLWLWKQTQVSEPGDHPATEGEAVPILGGRGRVLPLAAETRFTVLDAARGRVRLERGQVYVELEPGAGGAEVETSAGTARALGTQFYAHFAGAAGSLLAVAVLGGKVELDNAHGRTTCGPGEVAVAQPDAAPSRHGEGPGPHHHGFCPFVNTLGLIHRPEVQAELRLDDEQKARLRAPGTDERREICRFFRSLHGLPRAEWKARAQEFSDQLERRAAEVLTPAQQKRLRQIGHQQESYFALLRADVGRDLEVREDQRQAIERILVDFTKTRRALLDEALAPDERGRRIATAWREAVERAGALLTEPQKEHWRQRLGPPLDLVPLF